MTASNQFDDDGDLLISHESDPPSDDSSVRIVYRNELVEQEGTHSPLQRESTNDSKTILPPAKTIGNFPIYSQSEKIASLRRFLEENCQIDQERLHQYLLTLRFVGILTPAHLKKKLLNENDLFLIDLDFAPSHISQICGALGISIASKEDSYITPPKLSNERNLKQWLRANTAADAETIESYDLILRFSGITNSSQLKMKVERDVNFLSQRDFSAPHISQILRGLSVRSSLAMDLNAGASPDLMNQNLIKDMRTVFSFIGKYYKRKIVNGEKKVFVVLASGNLHCGHLDDRGLRTGLGIGILRNGDIYEGNFDGDRFSGCAAGPL